MTKYFKEYKRYYPMVIGAAIAFILMASYLITRNQKPREEFQYITGDVVYLSSVNPYRPQSEPREKILIEISMSGLAILPSALLPSSSLCQKLLI